MEGFELRITRQLEGVQSPDIAGVKVEIVELRKLIYELHEWPIYQIPIIMEIHLEDKVKNIGVLMIKHESCCRVKKNKKIKKNLG